jgi:hypothetical protein
MRAEPKPTPRPRGDVGRFTGPRLAKVRAARAKALAALGVFPVSFTVASKSTAMNSNQKAYWGFWAVDDIPANPISDLDTLNHDAKHIYESR